MDFIGKRASLGWDVGMENVTWKLYRRSFLRLLVHSDDAVCEDRFHFFLNAFLQTLQMCIAVAPCLYVCMCLSDCSVCGFSS